MLEEFQEEQRTRLARTRSIMNYTMGVLFFLIGVFFLIYRHFGIRLMDHDPSSIDYAIGGLFVAYGAWRVYRGYKKDYYQ